MKCWYLDWRPVVCAPVGDFPSLRVDLDESEVQPLLSEALSLNLVEEIDSISVAARLDGLFIFCITYHNKPARSHELEIARVVSSQMKTIILGHQHDFHNGAGSREFESEKEDRKFIKWIKYKNQISPDWILAVDPVPLHWPDPTIEIEEVCDDPTRLKAMMALYNGSKRKQRRRKVPALLRLRRIYVSKHEDVIRSIDWHRKTDPQLKFALRFIAVILVGLSIFGVTILTQQVSGRSIFAGAILGLTLSAFAYNYQFVARQRIPRIILLRSAIGFFGYVDVFSNVVSKIFGKDPVVGVEKSITLLETKVQGEAQAMETQRFIGGILISIFAIVLSLVALPGLLPSDSTAENESEAKPQEQTQENLAESTEKESKSFPSPPELNPTEGENKMSDSKVNQH